jgi:pseudaminic acid cytidylyltransferase
MENKNISIAIIPARGGSKRIKKKNIKNFCLKPILYWTFKVLKESKLFTKIVLTTDDDEIKTIGNKLGFDYIISRPYSIADDFTPTKTVIEHAIKILLEKSRVDYICCAYPCNPFINLYDLKKSFTILKKNTNNFIFPVTEYAHPIQRAFKLNKNNKVLFFNRKNELKRTQDLEKSYHDTGQFYWGTVANWLKIKNMHSNSIGFKIPNWRSVDIDNLDDWKRAELLFKILKQSKKN